MPSTLILDVSFLAILVAIAFMILRMRSLFAIVMLQGVYSLVSAAWFVVLDAVDVAFTEAAVGAGVSTVLMLSAMLLADRESNPVPLSRQMGPLFVVTIAGLAMFYAIGDMPAFGDVNSPANSYVGYDYLAKTADEIHIPNVVTAVLASYRGFDTFGEVVVIFAAGLGVLLLLGLNGNAGRWRASPNGVNICSHTVPLAERLPEAPAGVTAKPQASVRKATKTRAVKKTTVKKSVSRTASAKASPKKAEGKTVAKKVTAKKVAAKKPAAKKSGARKAASQKTTPKKITPKKPSTRKKPSTPKTPSGGAS